MLQEGAANLKKQIEEVRTLLNKLTSEKDKIRNDEQILKISRQLDKLIVSYMIN